MREASLDAFWGKASICTSKKISYQMILEATHLCDNQISTMKLLRFTICIFAVILVGCANDGTALPIGEQIYPPTDPLQVAILIEPPKRKHAVVGLVESQASTDDYLSKSRTQTAAIRILKEQAAKLGANAIVLTAKGSRPYAQRTMVLSNTNATANTFGTAQANVIGNTIYGSGNSVTNLHGLTTSTAMTFGWELMQFSGTAIRYQQ